MMQHPLDMHTPDAAKAWVWNETGFCLHALIIFIVFLHSVTYKQLLVHQKNETQKAC